MPKPRRPRKSLGFFDAQDKVLHLSNIYRGVGYVSRNREEVAQTTHREMDDVPTAEPGEDLEDSELNDVERNAAIARERMRREGRV